MVFVFEFVYIMDYVDGCPYINNPCIPGIKPTWIGWMIVLICSWIQLARILLSIFAFIFIREIGLKFSIFVGSFCGCLALALCLFWFCLFVCLTNFPKYYFRKEESFCLHTIIVLAIISFNVCEPLSSLILQRNLLLPVCYYNWMIQSCVSCICPHYPLPTRHIIKNVFNGFIVVVIISSTIVITIIIS